MIVRQIRSELNKNAEKESIEIFSQNLKSLLLQDPVKGKKILGIDPGFKTGCKVAVISELGDVLDTGVIYPNVESKKSDGDYQIIKNLLMKHG